MAAAPRACARAFIKFKVLEDDRPSAILGQVLLDLPHYLAPLICIGLSRLLVDQSVGLGVAIASIVALAAVRAPYAVS
ncbi:MAG: hypothetical protein WA709_28845 [Stellaceae bacterium]